MHFRASIINFLVQNQIVIGLIIQTVVAVGTLALAFIAIYGDNLRSKIFRPKIEIVVDNKRPFIEKIVNSSAGSSVAESVRIRIKIINYGGSVARSCVVLVDRIFKKRNDNESFHSFRDLAPSSFNWLSGKTHYDLRAPMPSYVEIARIEKTQESGEDTAIGGTTTTTPSFQLFTSVQEPGQKGVYVRLGRGTFVIPIVINPENSSEPKKEFIEIFWDGSRIIDSEDESHFYIKRLDKAPIGVN